MNQPIEEKWKGSWQWRSDRMGLDKDQHDEIFDFIENLLEQERNHYEKELKIADERWKRAEANHREKHESETEICVYH